MKLLWVVNIIFPFPAQKINNKSSNFGGWLLSMFNEIVESKDISQIIVAAPYKGKKMLFFENGKDSYYLIPCKNINAYDNKLEEYWNDIINDCKPDIIHIHGTEYPHSLALLNIKPQAKIITSIQGLISRCGVKEIYNAGISNLDMIKSITFRDVLKRDLLVWQYKKFQKRGEYEVKIIKNSDYIIGRTEWDKSEVLKINNKAIYFKNNENLRPLFYNKRWNKNEIVRHSVFIIQASYPLKGFHMFLKSARLLANKYKDFKVWVAGPNIIDTSSAIKKLKISGYGLYISKLIRKYNLLNNIVFIGNKKESEVVDYMLKANVFVQASSLENSSNSLCEAMILGLPCVASNVGGTSSLIKNKEEGLLYSFGDYQELAKNIAFVFDNPKKALDLGENARRHALRTNNKKENAEELLNIYKKVLK